MVAIVIFMHIRGSHRASSPKFRCGTHGSKFCVKNPPGLSFMGRFKIEL